MTSKAGSQTNSTLTTDRGVGRAWLLLCLALATHVVDEAMTGFLGVYNPTVLAMRQRLPWLPLPVFRFEVWIVGLVIAVSTLLALSVFVFRGARWTRPLAYVFAIIMVANGLGHTTGTALGRTVESVRFARPMPGFYSSPFLLAAAVYLLLQLRRSTATGGQPQLTRTHSRGGNIALSDHGENG